MKILGIDTSSKFLSIAVSEDKNIIREELYLLDRQHSSQLVPKIKELIGKSKLSIKKIDGFVIGVGPGSFTGLRIGVSAVKGFGIALGKPCIGVASIDAIACNAAIANNNEIIPIIDAKRGQVYAAIYRKKANQIIRISEYLLLPIDTLMKKIKGSPVFLGDGVSLYKDKISDMNRKAVFMEEKYWYPGAGNLIKLGFSRIKRTKKTDLAKLTPLYMYPEDCQVRKS
ncbi:MAG: tRNA (adenosine(37)-N6)-threonylcarbamoyltransferase complex dimerization subunit type 1 TsaB [Candidatus Omnitrophota bacterium]|nr:tRNA (adenosine(37)-N6)-threonylcarbamoyltransferase complex dimerization subunit type 1 TsaB [Candidatus Omnitrophota bacterium]